MCDLVALVMCVSLALVASSALPAASNVLPAASNALRSSADCTHTCLLRARTHEKESRSKSSCNFKLFCDTLCQSRSELVTVTPRLLRSLAASCRPRSRRSRSPAWAEAALIARSVGMDVLPETYSSVTQEEPPSNLRVTSLSRQGETVDCQLSWDSRQGKRWYLVTWETEAAGRGNLLTPSSPVTLTLLPTMRYHVQVSPSNSPEARVSLDVDTRSLQSPRASHQSTFQVLPLEQEAAAGVLAAALLFLGLVLVTVTRRRDLAKPAECERETQTQSKHFKVYSPPVTIVPVHLSSTLRVN